MTNQKMGSTLQLILSIFRKSSDPRCITLVAWGKYRIAFYLDILKQKMLYVYVHSWLYMHVIHGLSFLSDVDPCLKAQCNHGGTCVRTGYTQAWTCACPPGWTGNICQTGKSSSMVC